MLSSYWPSILSARLVEASPKTGLGDCQVALELPAIGPNCFPGHLMKIKGGMRHLPFFIRQPTRLFGFIRQKDIQVMLEAAQPLPSCKDEDPLPSLHLLQPLTEGSGATDPRQAPTHLHFLLEPLGKKPASFPALTLPYAGKQQGCSQEGA